MNIIPFIILVLVTIISVTLLASWIMPASGTYTSGEDASESPRQYLEEIKYSICPSNFNVYNLSEYYDCIGGGY